MDKRSIYAVLDRVLESSKVAVLASVDSDGQPRVRWMTPVTVPGREGSLFAVTAPGFEKTAQISAHPNVEWMLQTKSIDEVLTVRGVVQVLEDPRTKVEVLEAIGGNLSVFWRVNQDASELVVLETIIEEMVYFKPLTGEKELVSVK
jgi:pyridoxamine 5'-phosphate oxidase